MSLAIGCDTGNLSLDDIFRLVSGIDVDGNVYIRVCDDETPAIDLSNLGCTDTASMLDILRGALFLNDDGEYCLNVSTALAVPLFCATYQTIYDSLTTPPSDAIAAAQNTMVCGLVDDGVWAKLDLFYLFAQTTNGGGEALKNWVNPGTFDATAVDAPAFVALEGFSGDASADYIDTGWNPATDGINYVLDSATVGAYVRTDTAVGAEAGCLTGASRIYLMASSGGNFHTMVNQTTGLNVANVDSRGMYINTRTASNVVKGYKNKVAVTISAIVSTGIPSTDLFVLALSNSGAILEPTDRQVSLFFAGSGFIQADVDNITDRVETYMDSNGKGVIP